MNVFDISSHGNTLMCQIWYANVKARNSWVRQGSAPTDEQTDEQTDRVIPIFPP